MGVLEAEQKRRLASLCSIEVVLLGYFNTHNLQLLLVLKKVFFINILFLHDQIGSNVWKLVFFPNLFHKSTRWWNERKQGVLLVESLHFNFGVTPFRHLFSAPLNVINARVTLNKRGTLTIISNSDGYFEALRRSEEHI